MSDTRFEIEERKPLGSTYCRSWRLSETARATRWGPTEVLIREIQCHRVAGHSGPHSNMGELSQRWGTGATATCWSAESLSETYVGMPDVDARRPA